MPSKTHERGFLGIGWNYSLQPLASGDVGMGLDRGGRIAEAQGEQIVHQSIWLILSTAIGERVSRPQFGCAIHDLVFAPINAATLGQLDQAVREALETWEPRIELLGVRAEPAAGTDGAVTITVRYVISSTNSRFNLVYPFYLSPSEPA
jgi:uncharacterized protein